MKPLNLTTLLEEQQKEPKYTQESSDMYEVGTSACFTLVVQQVFSRPKVGPWLDHFKPRSYSKAKKVMDLPIKSFNFLITVSNSELPKTKVFVL